MTIEQLHRFSDNPETAIDTAERERITQKFNQIVNEIDKRVPADISEKLAQALSMEKVCGGSDGPGAGLGHP